MLVIEYSFYCQSQWLLGGNNVFMIALTNWPKKLLRTVLFVAVSISVAGCSNRKPPSVSTKQPISNSPQIINIGNKNLRIAPPPGFCKDQNSSKSTSDTITLMFLKCNLPTTVAQNDDFSGLITTSVAKSAVFDSDTNIYAVSDFLGSSQGLESLSSSGNAESVSLIDKRQTSDGVFLQFHDETAPLSKTIWKSFLNRSDHLVTVTLLQNQNTALSSEQSMQFLQSYSETIQTGNNRFAQETMTKNPNTTTQKTFSADKQFKKIGLLRRVFIRK